MSKYLGLIISLSVMFGMVIVLLLVLTIRDAIEEHKRKQLERRKRFLRVYMKNYHTGGLK